MIRSKEPKKRLKDAGFRPERFEWSINFKGNSKVSIQLTTEDMYRDFASRGVAADVHGILMRVASLEDDHGRQNPSLERSDSPPK